MGGFASTFSRNEEMFVSYSRGSFIREAPITLMLKLNLNFMFSMLSSCSLSEMRKF